ncbi:SGNH/GDSL hydrolase family protein [Moorena sp. SIO3H5]|uniref:SGNH/GDSL hydrolase family protein n=1 Tax=Moorena sp. SIO3H5 TaxID=2607834 RepID=UPI0013B6DA9D|nr:SGNH/GDSL hydrolase family protein [Moorena sp. SIO3H5]NEO70534.1 SGNH/GDSL hydrolase family protein [Moorena sp. SIO3H5]
MKNAITAFGFSLLSFVFPLSVRAYDLDFSNLYVFGDSLSDSGNAFNISKAANRVDPTIPIIPQSPPYFEGRFSNGPIWVDYLADSLEIDLKPSTDLSLVSPDSPILAPFTITPDGPRVSFFFNGATTNQSVNFAFGGAETGFSGIGEFGEFLPGLLTQVAGFTNDLIVSDQMADPNALYILWSGATDYLNIDPPNPTQVVGNIETALNSLYNFGARNFLVLNLPDLGKIPQSLSLDSVLSTGLTDLTEQHNSVLDSSLNVLSQSLPDINLISVDQYDLFDQILANPGNFGFSNVTETCLDQATFIACSNPDEFFFWDPSHPTTAGHQILAESALATLKSQDKDESKSVPEPVSSASLGVIGLAWLFRKQLKKSC